MSDTRQIQVTNELDDQDVLERAEQLVEVEKQLAELDQEKADWTDKWKGKVAEASANRRSLLWQIENRKENIMVECREVMDPGNRIVNYVSMSSGAHIDSRDMTAEEYAQCSMDDMFAGEKDDDIVESHIDCPNPECDGKAMYQDTVTGDSESEGGPLSVDRYKCPDCGEETSQ